MRTSSRQFHLGIIGWLVVLLHFDATAYGQPTIIEKDGNVPSKAAEKDGKGDPGFFIPIPEAKDCAFDHVRQRLYVTTLKQLVVVDMKERKILESIDLLGNLQGLDIAPQAKFLAIAPIGAQYVYKLNLDWKTADDMEFVRIRFKADGSEPGVFGIGVGADDSILFTTTYSGSGGVTLRRINSDDSIDEIGDVNMNSVIAVSGDRRNAFIGEGNISSGALQKYDFKEKKLTHVANLACFHYALACNADGSRIARPDRRGCDLYDAHGGKLGTLSGAPVIDAAYHPKSDTLFVMRHGELEIQAYDPNGKLLADSYPLDQPLVIKGDVHNTVIADLRPVGRDMVIANFRRAANVNYGAYRSGRLHVTEDGKSLCAVIPSGVYIFPIKESQSQGSASKRKVKIIDN